MVVNDDVDEHPRSSPLWQSVHSGGLLTGDLGAAEASHIRRRKETLLPASIKRVERTASFSGLLVDGGCAAELLSRLMLLISRPS